MANRFRPAGVLAARRARFARPRALVLLIALLMTGILGPVATPSPTGAAAGDDGAPGRDGIACAPAARFEPRTFSRPTRIDHRFFPLVPGTQLTLTGRDGDEPHRVVFTVTDLTKVIHGVRTVVVWDRDISVGQLEEAELAFFAQDDAGNVWSLGEYPEEYEDGRLVGAPSTWLAGREGAKAGVDMLATPRPAAGWYVQGYAPAIDFLDCAKVSETGARTCVPLACYDGVLVTTETAPLEPGDGFQLKYHAPGVGIVRVGARPAEDGETLALVKRARLGPTALANVRDEALKLDRRGCRVAPVYCNTPPAA